MRSASLKNAPTKRKFDSTNHEFMNTNTIFLIYQPFRSAQACSLNEMQFPLLQFHATYYNSTFLIELKNII